jgi:competence protein ComEC
MNGKMFYLAITAFLGILCSLSSWILFSFLSLLYLFFLFTFKQFKKFHLLLVIGAIFLFFLTGHKAVSKNHTIIPESATHFSLEYSQDAKIDGDLLQVMATDTRYKEKLLVRYKLKSESEKNVLKNKDFYGCVCKVAGTLAKPAIAKNPNGFNYRNYLETKQIFWIVESQESPLQACSPNKPSFLTMLKQVRFSGIQYLEHHFPPEIASLSAALIFGDRSLLSPDLLNDYQKSGIVHLLAISGLHVSLLVGMVFYIGIRIGLTRQFMTNFLLMILPIYVILTGASPSVIRASLMIFLILITVKWKKNIKLFPIDAISLAFMLYLLFAPFVLYDVGFQLSFSVSLGIILSAPSILKQYQKNSSRMIVTSIIAQLAAFPILLYHYFEISLISTAANLLYIPLFSFLYLPGLYILFLAQLIFGKTPEIILDVFTKIIYLSNHLIEQLANLPFAHFIPGRPNGLFLILYVLVIMAIFLIWEAGHYSKKVEHLLLLSFFLFSFQAGWNFFNPFGEVTMIDVGQGDCILIHLPNGKGNYLIDTGGVMNFNEEQWRKRTKPFEVGRDVVVPYLKGKGITTIDKLILTHGDMDHIGGAISIIKELKVKQILFPDVLEISPTERLIMEEAKTKGISVSKVSEGDQWKSDNAYFYILSPEKTFKGERNRGSISLLAKVGGLTWFSAGDLDQIGEENVIKKYPHLTVDVLKAGHHGSKTSSAESFIQQIMPKVALISVGEKNHFGHPHQEVLERIKKTNTLIFRTDQQGAITYRFYQEKGTFFPYLP